MSYKYLSGFVLVFFCNIAYCNERDPFKSDIFLSDPNLVQDFCALANRGDSGQALALLHQHPGLRDQISSGGIQVGVVDLILHDYDQEVLNHHEKELE